MAEFWLNFETCLAKSVSDLMVTLSHRVTRLAFFKPTSSFLAFFRLGWLKIFRVGLLAFFWLFSRTVFLCVFSIYIHLWQREFNIFLQNCNKKFSIFSAKISQCTGNGLLGEISHIFFFYNGEKIWKIFISPIKPDQTEFLSNILAIISSKCVLLVWISPIFHWNLSWLFVGFFLKLSWL